MNILKFISPSACLIITSIIFLISVAIPSNYYSYLMREANYMFGNIKLIGFFFVHVLFYSFGILMLRKRGKDFRNKNYKIHNHNVTIILLLIFVVLAIYSLFVVIQNNPNIIINFISGEGAETKETFDATGSLGLANPILLAILLWGMVEVKSIANISYSRKIIYKFLIYIGFFVLLISFSIRLSRFELMPLIFSIGCIYLLNNDERYMAQGKIYLFILFMFLSIIVLFVLFSYLRGIDDFEGHLISLIGYGPASYNRLAALLDGYISFPYSGTGAYAFAFLLNFPILGEALEIRELLNLPTSFEVWRSEFYAIASSGLDSSFNWVSAIGYVYEDISFFSLGYVFLLGLINTSLWGQFLRKKPVGVVLYPWFSFCTIFWFGYNYVVFPKLIVFICTALFVTFYTKKFSFNKSLSS